MEAKGCAKPAVWKEARRFFYWALRQKVVRSDYAKAIQAASPSITRDDAKNLVLSLLPPTIDIKDNRAVAEALETVDLEETLTELRDAEVSRQVSSFIQSNSRKAALNGLISSAQSLTEEERALLRTALEHASAA